MSTTLNFQGRLSCTPRTNKLQGLFRDIGRKILPAKAEDITKVFSTVIPGDQVDTALCSKRRENTFEERKDTTLSYKLIKNPPVRGQSGEVFIELREGYTPKK